MNELADSADRRRALTVLDQTLLVEAAAGTGKTSLLAGRVTMLLASGIAPRNIAAITFTELAAGELRVRVERFVNELLKGTIPEDLALAVDKALTAPQRAAFIAARARLDELTATTIHGFCHKLLRSYAIEAGVDPGAEVLDAVQTEFAFTTVFERWLRRRLGENADPTDPVVVMARRDPREAVDTLKKLGKFRRDFRTAKPLPRDLAEHADLEFVESVREFRRWIDGTKAPDRALEDVADLERLAAFFAGAFDSPPSFERLWELAHPPRVNAMAWRSSDLRPYRRLGAWKYVAGKDEGTRLAEQATSHYDQCAAEFRALLGSIATALVATFSSALDELLEDFEAYKRNAAVLDFDDLLLATRELLRGHEAVRQAASNRYTRILVDEFQDTDPVQAEILFLIASAPAGSGLAGAKTDSGQPVYRRRSQAGDLQIPRRGCSDLYGGAQSCRASVSRQYPADHDELPVTRRDSRPRQSLFPRSVGPTGPWLRPLGVLARSSRARSALRHEGHDPHRREEPRGVHTRRGGARRCRHLRPAHRKCPRAAIRRRKLLDCARRHRLARAGRHRALALRTGARGAWPAARLAGRSQPLPAPGNAGFRRADPGAGGPR